MWEAKLSGECCATTLNGGEHGCEHGCAGGRQEEEGERRGGAYLGLVHGGEVGERHCNPGVVLALGLFVDRQLFLEQQRRFAELALRTNQTHGRLVSDFAPGELTPPIPLCPPLCRALVTAR